MRSMRNILPASTYQSFLPWSRPGRYEQALDGADSTAPKRPARNARLTAREAPITHAGTPWSDAAFPPTGMPPSMSSLANSWDCTRSS